MTDRTPFQTARAFSTTHLRTPQGPLGVLILILAVAIGIALGLLALAIGVVLLIVALPVFAIYRIARALRTRLDATLHAGKPADHDGRRNVRVVQRR